MGSVLDISNIMEPWLHEFHNHCPICGQKYVPENAKNWRYKSNRFKVQPFYNVVIKGGGFRGCRCVYHLCYGCLQQIMKEKVTVTQARFMWDLDGDLFSGWYYDGIFSCFWHHVESLINHVGHKRDY